MSASGSEKSVWLEKPMGEQKLKLKLGRCKAMFPRIREEDVPPTFVMGEVKQQKNGVSGNVIKPAVAACMNIV